MTNRSKDQLGFPGCKGRKVEADFSGGNVTSDAGVLLLRQADRRLGLTSAVARLLADPRRQASCEHTSLSMLRQRVYGLAAGYEDLNDHDGLRHDLAWQTAVDRDKPSASIRRCAGWRTGPTARPPLRCTRCCSTSSSRPSPSRPPS